MSKGTHTCTHKILRTLIIIQHHNFMGEGTSQEKWNDFCNIIAPVSSGSREIIQIFWQLLWCSFWHVGMTPKKIKIYFFGCNTTLTLNSLPEQGNLSDWQRREQNPEGMQHTPDRIVVMNSSGWFWKSPKIWFHSILLSLTQSVFYINLSPQFSQDGTFHAFAQSSAILEMFSLLTCAS